MRSAYDSIQFSAYTFLYLHIQKNQNASYRRVFYN